MVEEVDRRDALLRVMSDEYVRKILRTTIINEKSIDEISHENSIPISTCYRRVHDLIDLHLLRVERTIITPTGKKYETFKSAIKDVRVSLSGDSFSVEVTPFARNGDGGHHNILQTAKPISNIESRQLGSSQRIGASSAVVAGRGEVTTNTKLDGGGLTVVDSGKHAMQSLIFAQVADYRPCLKCPRHPKYPDIPPMTLHKSERCVICENTI